MSLTTGILTHRSSSFVMSIQFFIFLHLYSFERKNGNSVSELGFFVKIIYFNWDNGLKTWWSMVTGMCQYLLCLGR